MAALLALGAALFWGVGDFLGGLATRRLHVLVVLAVSHAIGLVGLVLWVGVARDELPGGDSILAAIAAGTAYLVGLGALYRGLAIGAMGIVAPISAAAPLIPLTVDSARGMAPGVVQWVGVTLVLTGIVTLSREPTTGGRRIAAGVGLAIIAAVCIGLFFVGIDIAADEGAPWAVLISRATSLSLAVAALALTSTPLHVPLALVPALIGIGVCDAGANVFIAFATTKGTAGVVAVLGALYPLATIVLARLVLGERLSRARRLGGAVALAGAALVAAG